ncbi:MAG: glyoxylate/hydroxypyruvate reductase A [Rhodospirillaceae bacterium]|nr:glyoxylate/hydroxypyruvate reductase A [Rhodospirillaceae bacterium]
MTTVLISSQQDPIDLWRESLALEMPELEVRAESEIGDDPADRADIDYALVYWPPHGLIASLPNVKAVLSIAAGCDHILADPQLPPQLPIVRMVDDYLAAMMAEYAVYGVLHFHRDMHTYRQEQLASHWNRGWPLYTPETAVGILGLGAIGGDCAAKLGAMGFQVHGWSRRPKSLAGVTCHHGPAGLLEMAGQCRYLVCVLPLTPQTQGIINKDLINAMPRGGFIVNIARGGHQVDEDLLAALDSGQLGGIFLDVFNAEPLPAEHPYWQHNKVWMTPHIAGELMPRSCAKSVVANIRRIEAGEPVPHLLDKSEGY